MRLEPLRRSARLLSVRGLRANARWAAGLALVVAVSTAAVALFPSLYADAQDDALREEAARATPRERDLEVVQAARLPAGSLGGSGAQRLRTIPPELARLVDRRTLVVDTPVYGASSAGGSPDPTGTIRLLTLRVHDRLAEHIRFLRGAPPESGARGPLQIALSDTTAAALSVRVGDRLLVQPNVDQPQLVSVPFVDQQSTMVKIAGIFIARGDDPYWFGDLRSLRPQIEETESARIVRASGLLPLATYPALLARTGRMPLSYRWRYHVAAERLDTAGLGELEAAARSLELRYGAVAESGSAVPEARTGIGRIFERFREQQRVASASLSFAGAGFVGLALIVVIAVAFAGGAALRRALALARDRGGSAVGAAVTTALALVLPAALAGLVVAAIVGRPDGLGVTLALALALVAAAAITVVVAPRVRAPQDALAARQLREQRGRRRAAIESTLVTVAIAGAVALRTRTESPEGFDLLAAATPVLVVLAVAALALRLARPLARLAAVRLSGRVDLAPILALRRIERQGALGAPPLVVPLVAAAVATFSSLTNGGAEDVSAPLLETVSSALTAISYLSVSYAATAIVVVVVVIVRERAEEGARLTELGLRRGQGLALGLGQLVPTIAAGAVLGALAAGLAFVAVRPAFAAAEAVSLGAPLVVVLALTTLPLVGAIAVTIALGYRRTR
ncbi:MAG: hypothetical protein MSC30_19800 [Gaiellaceae bacterium MAG52_C11]|nr:hypothetical protein [Candidatus Gaiellasilicea maunaloa]